MGAPKKNKYWLFRDKHGRDKKYTPEELWNEFVSYMEWLEKEPFYEVKPMVVSGKLRMAKIPKMRAATQSGFCLFADITTNTLKNYRNDKDFFHIVTRIDETIRTQKFEGAAAELLNSNIIARDLGLRDGMDHTTLGEKITPTVIAQSEEQQKKIDELLSKFDKE